MTAVNEHIRSALLIHPVLKVETLGSAYRCISCCVFCFIKGCEFLTPKSIYLFIYFFLKFPCTYGSRIAWTSRKLKGFKLILWIWKNKRFFLKKKITGWLDEKMTIILACYSMEAELYHLIQFANMGRTDISYGIWIKRMTCYGFLGVLTGIVMLR